MRLQGYDYRQSGAYFVTICTYQRYNTFGTVIDGNMVLNQWGEIVNEEWRRTDTVRANVELDAYVIMPNHLHGVVLIVEDARYIGQRGRLMNTTIPICTIRLVRSGKLSDISNLSLQNVYGQLAATREAPVWQRGYYEHIIRNEKSLNEIRAYIISNPGRWSEDSLNISGRMMGESPPRPYTDAGRANYLAKSNSSPTSTSSPLSIDILAAMPTRIDAAPSISRRALQRIRRRIGREQGV